MFLVVAAGTIYQGHLLGYNHELRAMIYTLEAADLACLSHGDRYRPAVALTTSWLL